MMKHYRVAAVMVLSASVAACQLAQDGDGGGALPAGYGRLSVELVDAPAPKVKEVVVTVSKVTAHSNTAGWVTIMSTPVTVDLLTLKDQSMALGFANLPAGKVTQIRLYVDETGPRYVTLPNGDQINLSTPSGVQSGIKIKGPFEITACETSTVTLDFDGQKSLWVHPTGQNDRWILRPVIHTKKVVTSPTGCGTAEPPPSTGDADGGTGLGEGTGLPGNPPGASCSEQSQCLSGVCASGACATGGPGTPCGNGEHCASGECTAEGTCSNGGAGGAGTACAAASECLSNACVDGTCATGGTGTGCHVAADCHEGLSCVSSICQPIIN